MPHTCFQWWHMGDNKDRPILPEGRVFLPTVLSVTLQHPGQVDHHEIHDYQTTDHGLL